MFIYVYRNYELEINVEYYAEEADFEVFRHLERVYWSEKYIRYLYVLDNASFDTIERIYCIYFGGLAVDEVDRKINDMYRAHLSNIESCYDDGSFSSLVFNKFTEY